jgi:hypothetical protein
MVDGGTMMVGIGALTVIDGTFADDDYTLIVGGGTLTSVDGTVIPDFVNKTKYALHVCPGSFIPHTRT